MLKAQKIFLKDITDLKKQQSYLYRQFSRRKYNKYRAKYPRMRQSQILSKIIRQWQFMEQPQKIGLLEELDHVVQGQSSQQQYQEPVRQSQPVLQKTITHRDQISIKPNIAPIKPFQYQQKSKHLQMIQGMVENQQQGIYSSIETVRRLFRSGKYSDIEVQIQVAYKNGIDSSIQIGKFDVQFLGKKLKKRALQMRKIKLCLQKLEQIYQFRQQIILQLSQQLSLNKQKLQNYISLYNINKFRNNDGQIICKLCDMKISKKKQDSHFKNNHNSQYQALFQLKTLHRYVYYVVDANGTFCERYIDQKHAKAKFIKHQSTTSYFLIRYKFFEPPRIMKSALKIFEKLQESEAQQSQLQIQTQEKLKKRQQQRQARQQRQTQREKGQLDRCLTYITHIDATKVTFEIKCEQHSGFEVPTFDFQAEKWDFSQHTYRPLDKIKFYETKFEEYCKNHKIWLKILQIKDQHIQINKQTNKLQQNYQVLAKRCKRQLTMKQIQTKASVSTEKDKLKLRQYVSLFNPVIQKKKLIEDLQKVK